MGWLDGQVALVTGGGSGIGRAVVERFLAEGASVGVLERSSAKLSELKEDIGKNVVVVQGDASSFADSSKAVEETVAAFGRLDIFVGNAGVFDHNQRLDTLDESQIEDAFDELFGINVKGPVPLFCHTGRFCRQLPCPSKARRRVGLTWERTLCYNRRTRGYHRSSGAGNTSIRRRHPC